MTPSILESMLAKAGTATAPAASFAKSRRVIMAPMISMRRRQGLGDGLGDLLAVEAAVFDENLVGVHAGDDHAREIHPLAVAFQSLRIGARLLRLRIETDAERCQEFRSGR